MLLSKRLAKFKYYLTKYFEIFSNIEKNASSYFDENVEHNMNFPEK
jgi:3-methyladenine DNA glycosylase AlkC